MSRDVAPKNISPLIKGARYAFLIAGWLYGMNKKAIFSAIESREKPKREAAMNEEKKQRRIKSKANSVRELKDLFKEIGLEPDPGWESSI